MRPRFSDLQPSLQFTFIAILRYLESKGQNCFTYKGLRAWMAYNRDKQLRQYEWHTVERAIRKLAEMEVLRRVNGKGNKVIFCRGSYFYDLKLEYLQRLRSHNAEPPKELKTLLEYVSKVNRF